MNHFNNLTPAEAERLALLLEELGEVQQVIGKILRHGYASAHPNSPDVTNRELLQNEIGDVCAAFQIMDDAGDIEEFEISRRKLDKLGRVGKWLHHNSVQK